MSAEQRPNWSNFGFQLGLAMCLAVGLNQLQRIERAILELHESVLNVQRLLLLIAEQGIQ